MVYSERGRPDLSNGVIKIKVAGINSGDRNIRRSWDDGGGCGRTEMGGREGERCERICVCFMSENKINK